MSKKAAAINIYREMKHTNPKVTRADIVSAFQRQVGLTKAGANNYYYQINKTEESPTESSKQSVQRVPAEIHKLVEDKTRECIRQVEEHYGRKFCMPEIKYTYKGAAAGFATYRTWSTTYQGDMLVQNIDNGFIEDTVPHEIAHLIDREVNGIQYRGSRRSVHGPSWKAVLKIMNGNDSRTHNYDMSTIQRKLQMKYTYGCACGTSHHFIGAKTHRKIQRGMKIICKTCNQPMDKNNGREAGRITYQEHLERTKTSTSA